MIDIDGEMIMGSNFSYKYSLQLTVKGLDYCDKANACWNYNRQKMQDMLWKMKGK